MQLQRVLDYKTTQKLLAIRAAAPKGPRITEAAIKTIPFKDLPDGSLFKIGTIRDVFKKIGNSHSVNQRTKQDAIFTLNSPVRPFKESFRRG